MKKRVKNWIKSIINKVKSNWRIADLLSDQPVLSEKELGRFVNSDGYEDTLTVCLRDQLKPGWKSMLVSDSKKTLSRRRWLKKKHYMGMSEFIKQNAC